MLLPARWPAGTIAGFSAAPLLMLNPVTTAGLDWSGDNSGFLLAAIPAPVGLLVAIERKVNPQAFALLVSTTGEFSGELTDLLLNGHEGAIGFLAGETITISLIILAAISLLLTAEKQWIKVDSVSWAAVIQLPACC